MVSFEVAKLRYTCFLLAEGFEDPDIALRKPYRIGNRMELKELPVSTTAPTGTRAFLGVKNGKTPRWAIELAAYIPGIDGIKPQSHRFVLFLPVRGRVFAVCFGYGSSALEWSAIEGNFGIKAAARLLAPSALKEVRSRKVSSSARTQSVILPLGGGLREMDVDLEGEFVRKLVGKLERQGATLAQGATLISGDSIGFDDIADLEALQLTLEFMLDAVSETSQRSEFEFIDALVPIPAGSELAAELGARLAGKILGEPVDGEAQVDGNVHFLEMIPPDDLVMDDVDTITVTREARKVTFRWDERPGLGSLVRELGVTRGKAFLKDARVTAQSVEGNPIGPTQPLLNWIVFEFGGSVLRYILSFGRWFSLSEKFATKLNADLSKISDVTAQLALPEMNAGEREGDYNERVANSRTDMICLDQVDIRPEGGSEVEACDLFEENGYLIHVKKWDGSQDMSHHLAQGAVSAELLRGDTTYQAAFVAAVIARDTTFERAARDAPNWVTWAVAIDDKYDFPLGLPSFSKINLRDAAKRVRQLRAVPTLARISRRS